MLNPPMTYSRAGLLLTESFEGLSYKAYQDKGGVWTIGRGHTRGVGPGLTCIPAQAEAWAQEDCGWAEATVNALVCCPLTQGQFDALVDFEFNTGGLKGSSMLGYLNTNNYMLAADEFEKWDHVNGVEVAGLLRRREADRKEFEQGVD